MRLTKEHIGKKVRQSWWTDYKYCKIERMEYHMIYGTDFCHDGTEHKNGEWYYFGMDDWELVDEPALPFKVQEVDQSKMTPQPSTGYIGELFYQESNQWFEDGGYWKVNSTSPIELSLRTLTPFNFRGDHGNARLSLTAGGWLVSERKNIKNKWCIVAERTK